MSERRPSPPRRPDSGRDYERDYRSNSSRYDPSRSYEGGRPPRRRIASPPYSRGGGGRGRGGRGGREGGGGRYHDDDREWDRRPLPPRDGARPYRPAPAPYEGGVPPARDARYDGRDRDDRHARRAGRRLSLSRSPPPRSSGQGRSGIREDSRRDDEAKSRRDVKNHDQDGEDGEVKEEQRDTQGADGPSEDDMMAMMGFGGFNTTKGKKIAGNEGGAAEIKKERTWRQYMNRRGGFNRPLDKI